MYGLSENAIYQICAVLRSFPAIGKALLFGSRAKGTHKEGSDIDLCLFGELEFTLLQKISIALDDLLLFYSFDLIAHGQLENKALVSDIERRGLLFFKR